MFRLHINIRTSLSGVTVLCLFMLAIAVVAGCDQAGPIKESSHTATTTRSTTDGPYTVVATTAMVADIVKHVAGDRATVKTLMHAGVDPHLYRATRSDMAAMLAADVVFYNGLNLEGRMSDAFVKVATAGKPVFAITELLDEDYLLEPEGFEGHYDPHVWMDPNGWMKAADVVIEKLAAFDPLYSQQYRSNGAAYKESLKQLDEYAQRSLGSIPEERRVLVTAHDAFNYFARAYKVQVEGIQGISTDSQAGMRQIESLIELIVARTIPAVFTESSVPPKNVQALVEGAKARGHEVRIGGELFSDAMGAEGTYEGTYIGMIDHNITTIVRALGGDAPQRGLSGKLHAAYSN
jgi:manganese/zinc/iron transport system substrate-binding protein